MLTFLLRHLDQIRVNNALGIYEYLLFNPYRYINECLIDTNYHDTAPLNLIHMNDVNEVKGISKKMSGSEKER